MNLPSELPGPWFFVTSEQAQTFEREARNEIGHGHQLKGKRLRAIAKCERCDNIVFEVSGDAWAVVHLTWKGSGRYSSGRDPFGWKRRLTREKPPWPSTEVFGSVEDLMVELNEGHH